MRDLICLILVTLLTNQFIPVDMDRNLVDCLFLHLYFIEHFIVIFYLHDIFVGTETNRGKGFMFLTPHSGIKDMVAVVV